MEIFVISAMLVNFLVVFSAARLLAAAHFRIGLGGSNCSSTIISGSLTVARSAQRRPSKRILTSSSPFSQGFGRTLGFAFASYEI